MALRLRWVGESELDQVAQTRLDCYGNAGKDLERFKEMIRADTRASAGDFLLAERDGATVGTATSLTMTMWVRGAAVPCQGVAWVGAIKTARRSGGEDRGVATAVMREVIAEARRREQVISTLMPFRASFYDHFGYGLTERRTEWTIPLSILHAGNSGGWRNYVKDDLPGMMALHQQIVQDGHCDVERPPARWEIVQSHYENGMAFVLPGEKAVRAWMIASHSFVDRLDILKVEDFGCDSHESLSSMLGLIGSLRDQYYSVIITVPADFQLNRLLKEMQLPHRPVNHETAVTRSMTRLQSRILDHKLFLEAMKLPYDARGRVDVAVHETEGHVSRFSIELDGSRAAVKPGGNAQFECSDRQWASIACGDISATHAVQMGLAKELSTGAAAVLDHLARGPLPFCHEHF